MEFELTYLERVVEHFSRYTMCTPSKTNKSVNYISKSAATSYVSFALVLHWKVWIRLFFSSLLELYILEKRLHWHAIMAEQVIDCLFIFNIISICLVLFYAMTLGNCVPCMFIFTFLSSLKRFIYLFISFLCMVLLNMYYISGPVGWGCIIHRIPFCRGVRFPNESYITI